jgi:lysophospholipase L1-like esterase
LLCVDVPHAYPTVLGAMLESSYPQSTTSVFNAGLGGEPAAGQGEARLPTVLAAQNPQVLLLLDGTNDLLGGQAAAIPTIVNALRNMIHSARSMGVQYIFVSTLLPQRPGGTPPRGTASAFVAQANDAIRPMVTSEGAALVDAYVAFLGHETTYLANDGLHVTPTGNQVLAQTFFNAMKAGIPLLR